jgi:outer membrane protein
VRSVWAVGALALSMIGGAAAAQTQGDDAAASWLSPSRVYLHVGPGALVMNAGATIKIAGTAVPDADATIDPQVTAIAEVGYMVNRNIGVSFTGGYPPTASVVASGSLEGYGTLGKAQYGPMALTAHYHFDGLGPLRPYVGAGPVVMVVFNNHDALVTHLNTHASVGYTLQGGAEYRIDRHFGLFFDVKKAFLKTDATGQFGPAPVRASIRLDPVVLSGGLAYRF